MIIVKMMMIVMIIIHFYTIFPSTQHSKTDVDTSIFILFFYKCVTSWCRRNQLVCALHYTVTACAGAGFPPVSCWLRVRSTAVTARAELISKRTVLCQERGRMWSSASDDSVVSAVLAGKQQQQQQLSASLIEWNGHEKAQRQWYVFMFGLR